MQLFAYQNDGRVILAEKGTKGIDYFCRECGGIVRIRGGSCYQTHFFHLQRPAKCFQSEKSLTHLQLQKHFYHLFPEGECSLEKRFPSIQRIADVCWEPKKLIFEIQCSPISKMEVEMRNRDYASLGYQVIWILHERRFNRWRLTEAECFLEEHPHYFTNMNNQGEGVIYDLLSVLEPGIRTPLFRLTHPKFIDPQICSFTTDHPSLHEALTRRLRCWPIYFPGDLIDLTLNKREHLPAKLLAKKQRWKIVKKWWLTVQHLSYLLVIRPYLLVLQVILEKVCR